MISRSPLPTGEGPGERVLFGNGFKKYPTSLNTTFTKSKACKDSLRHLLLNYKPIMHFSTKLILLACLLSSQLSYAQSDTDEGTTTATSVPEMMEDKKSQWSANFEVSFISRFIWRGLELGEYPSIQPNVTISKGSFFTGIWASHALAPAETAAGNITGYKEVIPYIGYGFKLSETSNLTLLVLDHYNPNAGGFFDYSRKGEDVPATNRIELRTLFNAGNFDFFGAADVYNDPSDNVSIYLEFGYTITLPKDVKLRPLVSFTPADSYYTTDGKADVTQVGFITSKAINLTDKLNLSAKVDMIYNPDRDNFYSAFGFAAKF